MSEESNSPVMGEPVKSTAEAVNSAAKQTNTPVIPGEKSQAELEAMSGAELAKYFADQKAKEQANPQPRRTDGKFDSKQTSNTPAAVKEAAQEAIRKFKVKVDGAELEVDENELLRGYSHQRAANKQLQEGKAARKQAEDFINMMKDKGSLFDVIRKLGHDPRQLSEEYLASQLQEELMDPKEKEFRDAKAKLKHFEDIEKKQRDELQRQYNDQMKQKYADDYSKQFVSALQETGLPPTKPMVAEMAKYIGRAAKMGYEMTAKDAASLVKEDIKIAHQRLIGEADAEQIMKMFGEDAVAKIRQYDVAKIKTPEQVLKNIAREEQADEHRERRQSGGNKRMSAKEWREFNRKGKK